MCLSAGERDIRVRAGQAVRAALRDEEMSLRYVIITPTVAARRSRPKPAMVRVINTVYDTHRCLSTHFVFCLLIPCLAAFSPSFLKVYSLLPGRKRWCCFGYPRIQPRIAQLSVPHEFPSQSLSERPSCLTQTSPARLGAAGSQIGTPTGTVLPRCSVWQPNRTWKLKMNWREVRVPLSTAGNL